MTMIALRSKLSPNRQPTLTAVLALCAAGVLSGVFAGAVEAQQTKGQPKTVAPAPQPATKAEAAPPASSESGLRLRVEQLEEQLVDMQVVVGTLESLARGGAGNAAAARASGGGGGGGADPARVEQLEGQVRALVQQVEQLNAQVSRQGASAGPGAGAGSVVANTVPPAPPLRPSAPAATPPAASSDRDPIGQIIGGTNVPAPIPGRGQPPSQSASSGQLPGQSIPAPIPGQASQPTPSIPQATASDASSKQLYETAYGLLLQQDYAAAEAAFDEFLRRYPGDPLAGNAQYWLGETFYVRGNFKSAAGAFLRGYQSYGRSSKAPDSLLKLAMSLDRLGQRDAACSSYGELSIKFPSAPGAVKNRADNERRRLGCP
jgi:tol-pal system protein YbgF